jgi:hypothetical protein
VVLTLCHGVRVQAGSQASELDSPAVRFFEGSLRLWLMRKKGWTLDVVEEDPGLLHARCPYSGRTLLSVFDLTAPVMGIDLELGADPTAQDWQVRPFEGGVRHGLPADLLLWQGRGLFYWAAKSNVPFVWQDLLVRGVRQGPISYRRRPSASCQPDFAESLGYVATIAGLEYFDQQISSKCVNQVSTLPCCHAESFGQKHRWQSSSVSLRPLPVCCSELRPGGRHGCGLGH